MAAMRSGYVRLFVFAVLVFAAGFGARLAWELSPIAGAQTAGTLEALQSLEVEAQAFEPAYSRERFLPGGAWGKASDFGWDVTDPSCTVREAALIRDGENVEVGS